MSVRSSAKRRSTLSVVIMYVIAAVLVAAIIVGNFFANRYYDLVSLYFGQATQKVVDADGTQSDQFVSDFDSDDDRDAYLEKVTTDISREGITLVQNDGGLPLAEGAKISVFGQDSVDPVFGGGGAGSVDTGTATGLGDGLKAAGLDVNPTLWDFYVSGAGEKFRKTTPDVYGEGEYRVNEVPQSAYTADVKASFADYSDAAVVVIGRSGGETADLRFQKNDTGYAYLQLEDEERDMIALATENFDNVVVVLNTSNPIELAPLEEAGVDATLWVGSLGQNGATAVGEALVGAINPSGALVDTYAYDSLSAPAMANFGNYAISNSKVMWGGSYLTYAEGIYVGYKYYETRYEDSVLGTDGAGDFDYSTAVQYPFGHGLSYTDFAWSDYTVDEGDDVYTVNVTVENTGDVAGKDIVQVYLQSPYTDYDRENGIEKAAVDLVGYAKTDALEPGDSETVSVEVPKELLRTYDADGAGTYIVDEGTYYLAAADDAHAALNDILAAKGFTTADGMTAEGNAAMTASFDLGFDDTTYAVSQATGEPIENQFADADMRTWDDEFTYLSRSDWTGTWPTTYADGAWEAPAEFVKALEIPDVNDPDAEKPAFDTVDDTYGEITAATLIGEDYDSPAWEALLSQASLDELEQLVRVGGYATKSVDSIQLPGTILKDGPAGFSNTLTGGDSGIAYPPAVVLASSWNDDLSKEFGNAIGEESLELGNTGWYAPSMNIHRSPYSGRNFEYYSEDGFLSGKMGAATVEGAQSKGVLVFVKHFALNDQETNRMGGAMMAGEQAIREIYLKPFEITVREGGARGMMAAMNRIGTRWVGAMPSLMQDTLRGEWGFQGLVETDQASFEVFSYEDLRAGLASGTDMWLNSDANLWKLDGDQMTASVQRDVMTAAHNIAYAIVNSNAMNGLASGGKLVSVTPLWYWGLIAAEVVLGLAALALVFFATRALIRRRKKTVEVVPAE